MEAATPTRSRRKDGKRRLRQVGKLAGATAALASLPLGDAATALASTSEAVAPDAGTQMPSEQQLATHFAIQTKIHGQQWRAAGTASLVSTTSETDAENGAVRVHVVAQDQAGRFAGEVTYTDQGGVMVLASLTPSETTDFVAYLYLPDEATGNPRNAGRAPEGWAHVQPLPDEEAGGGAAAALPAGCLFYVYRPYIGVSDSVITSAAVADCTSRPRSITIQTWGQKHTTGGWIQVSYYADSVTNDWGLWSFSARRCNGSASRTYRTKAAGYVNSSGKTGYSTGVALKCS